MKHERFGPLFEFSILFLHRFCGNRVIKKLKAAGILNSGGTPHNSPYGAPPERGTFLYFPEYESVGVLLRGEGFTSSSL